MTEQEILFSLGALGLASLASQWLAWRLRLPAILFLLLTGILAGPVLGWLDPTRLFGSLLFPLVSLAVALILFEGSLTLRLSELPGIGMVVRRLISIGALTTWGIITLTAHWLLGFEWDLALLLGSLTLVTGPTVIVPMLRVVRPNAVIANILRWEGIIIDPIGALLAVVVYSFIITRGIEAAWTQSLLTFGAVLLCGTLFGIAGGWTLGQLVKRHWLPEYLQNLATLASVLGVFVAANTLVHESGLLAVTLMGIWLANMRGVDVRDILHFKENLSILLISGLFILLAARLDLTALMALGPSVLILLMIVQFVARPLTIALCTWGSQLSWRERLLLAWISPRGIVAAAVSAIFAVRLDEAGHENALLLVPLTFAVIIGTVVLQSATARPLARLLKVAEPSPNGFLIVGANPVARAIGRALSDQGVRVMLTDSNWDNIRAARMENLPTYYGNPASQHAENHLDLVGVGHLLALSPVGEMNTLAAMRFRHEFGVERLFNLASTQEDQRSDKHRPSDEHRGRPLGAPTLTFSQLAGRLARGDSFKCSKLTETFGWPEYQARQGSGDILYFALDNHGHTQVFHPEAKLKPEAGWTLIALTQAAEEQSAMSKPEPSKPNLP